MRTFIGILLLLSVSWGMAQQVVNKLADTNDGTCNATDCSLREAIAAAAEDATITFSVSGTINLGSELAVTQADLTIDASGQTITVSGQNTHRVFNHTGTGTFEIINLVVTNGNATGSGGGGIRSSGAVEVTNSTLSGNSASFGGGGGIDSDSGDVTVTNSTLSGNSADFSGGGIDSSGGAVTVTNSTLSGNSASFGSGGGINSGGAVTVTNSTLSGNSAGNEGGGITSTGDVTLTNSLVLGNDAPSDPQISTGGTGSLVDYNSAYGFGTGESAGDSFVSFGINDVFTNHVVAASAPTTTGDYTLKGGSPAIDAGNNASAPAGNDLAGNPRIQGGTVDMGAYESAVPVPTDVTNTNDTGTGSLREAIAAAAEDATITFSVSGTINLGSELAVTQADLTIDASGQTITVSGQNTHRVFNHTGTGTFAINNLEVTNGNAAGDGGGISSDGAVEVTNSTLSGNSAGESSPGSFDGNGGGIDSDGDVTVTDSTLSGNSANAGGGIASGSNVTVTDSTLSGNSTTAANGGGIVSIGTVTVTGSLLSGNSADNSGGGILGGGAVTVTDSTLSGNSASNGDGGGIYSNVAVVVTNSTLSGNSAFGDGGGIGSFGTVTVTNSTLSGNSASNGDGGGIDSNGAVTVTNSTLSGNSASNGDGGGIRSTGDVTLTNSLVLGNDAPSDPQISTGGTLTNYNSAYGFGTGESAGDSFVTFGINDVFTNHVVAASAPTTAGDYTLIACSPAINVGNNTPVTDNGITNDLAGNDRIQVVTVDMGAFESALQACQTIDFDLTPLPAKAFGDADFDISGFASTTSGLAVTFNSATPAVCTVTGSTVSIITAGTCTIEADQTGNAAYLAAPQVTQDITINDNDAANTGSGSAVNPNQDIQIRNGTTTAAETITSGAIEPLRYGTFKRGQAVTLDFLIRNPGAQVLELGELSLPSFLNNAGEPLPETLASFASALLTVEVDTSSAGTFTGEFSLASNDPDAFENPFVFDVVVTVSNTPANAINVSPGVDLGVGNISAGQQDVVLLSFKVEVPAGSVPANLEGIALSTDSLPSIEQASSLRLYIDGGTRGVLDTSDVLVSSTTDTAALTFTFPTRTFSPNLPMWFIVVGDF